MSDEQSMESLMGQIDDSMKAIAKGDVIEGTVVAVKEDEVVINIGHFSDGIISNEELADERLKVGDKISVYVLNPHDKEGNVILSQKRAVQIVAWEELQKAFENKERIQIKVIEVTKGGVVAFYKTIRCFIPGSLLAYRYVEDMSKYVGKELEVRVEDLDLEKKRVVLSKKAVEVEERDKLKEALFSSIEVGKKYKGTVTKLMNFGAFVDIGGAEGLVHISELSWNRVKHPSEVVAEDDEVEVEVLKFDSKTKKIGLGLKKVEDDPWNTTMSKYRVGDIVNGKVVRLTGFGAFVEIEPAIEGLVHVSEISSSHVNKPSDVLGVGDRIEAEILKIDLENKKLGLSIKEAEGQRGEDELQGEKHPEESTTLGDIFGDKLKDFFKE